MPHHLDTPCLSLKEKMGKKGGGLTFVLYVRKRGGGVLKMRTVCNMGGGGGV